MQHVDMPLRGHPSEFSMEIEDSFCKQNNNLSTIKESVQLDGHGRMRNSFGETENNDDTWGGNFWFAFSFMQLIFLSHSWIMPFMLVFHEPVYNILQFRNL